MPYSLASVAPCVDMRYPFAQDSPYDFYGPFNEENLFNSDCNIKIVRVDNVKPSSNSNMELKELFTWSRQPSPEGSKFKFRRQTRDLSPRSLSPRRKRNTSPNVRRDSSPRQRKIQTPDLRTDSFPRNRNVIVNTAQVDLSRPIKKLSLRKGK